MENENERPGFWAVLPAAVRYDPQLPSTAKLLYAEISSLTDMRGYCFAPNSYFMEMFRISERTLQDHLRTLKAGGYIRISDGDGGSGRRKIYAGINPLKANPAENCGDPREKLRGNPAENCTHNKKDNKKEEHTGAKKKKWKAECEYEPELFERLWKLYPRHEGKGEARYAWDELRPNRKLMMVMSDALKSQKETDEWRRGVGIPWLVRWLNERRWEWTIGIQDDDESEDPDDEEVLEWL